MDGVSDAIHDAMAKLWQKYRGRMYERLDAVDAGLAAEPTAGSAARVDTRREAHKLAGSLGTFGLGAGSELAREVEQALDHGTPDWSRLRAAASELRDLLDSKA
jgi:HPt (histidine-containing phosphotransfer) domain-containing protein